MPLVWRQSQLIAFGVGTPERLQGAGTEGRCEALHILSGTILPHWGVLQRCLRAEASERMHKVRAVRVQPTGPPVLDGVAAGAAEGDGAPADALLGIRLPEGAVERVRRAIADAQRSGEVQPATHVQVKRQRRRTAGTAGAPQQPAKRSQKKEGAKKVAKWKVSPKLPPSPFLAAMSEVLGRGQELAPGGYWACKEFKDEPK